MKHVIDYLDSIEPERAPAGSVHTWAGMHPEVLGFHYLLGTFQVTADGQRCLAPDDFLAITEAMERLARRCAAATTDPLPEPTEGADA